MCVVCMLCVCVCVCVCVCLCVCVCVLVMRPSNCCSAADHRSYQLTLVFGLKSMLLTACRCARAISSAFPCRFPAVPFSVRWWCSCSWRPDNAHSVCAATTSGQLQCWDVNSGSQVGACVLMLILRMWELMHQQPCVSACLPLACLCVCAWLFTVCYLNNACCLLEMGDVLVVFLAVVILGLTASTECSHRNCNLGSSSLVCAQVHRVPCS